VCACVRDREMLFVYTRSRRIHACIATHTDSKREERSKVCENPKYQQVWVLVIHNRGVFLAIDCNVTGGCSPRNASSVYITLVAELGLAIIRVALPPRSASAGPRTTVPYRQPFPIDNDRTPSSNSHIWLLLDTTRGHAQLMTMSVPHANTKASNTTLATGIRAAEIDTTGVTKAAAPDAVAAKARRATECHRAISRSRKKRAKYNLF